MIRCVSQAEVEDPIGMVCSLGVDFLHCDAAHTSKLPF